MGLTLIRKSRGPASRTPRRVALVLAGGAISGGAFKVGGIKALEDFIGKPLFDRKAQAMTSAIERRAYTSSAYLRAGAALFSTQADVTPAVFRRFVSELRLDSNYRGAEGIGWAPVVAASQLRSFEGRLNAERISDKTVRPTLQEQPREILTPILYMQPDTARNRRALGYDMYSQPVRRTAMDLAAAKTEEAEQEQERDCSTWSNVAPPPGAPTCHRFPHVRRIARNSKELEDKTRLAGGMQ